MSWRASKRPLSALIIASSVFFVLSFLRILSQPRVDIEGAVNVNLEGCSPPAPSYSVLLPAVYDDDRGLRGGNLQPLDSIPPLLHLQWKSQKLPHFALTNLRAWRRLHPSWRVVLWTDEDLLRLARLALGTTSALGATFHALPKNIVRVDFTRYLILQLFGGVYADIDILPTRNLSPVLRHHSCVLAREPEPFSVSISRHNAAILAANVLMASRPGHPFWGVLMARVRASGSKADALAAAGPLVVTDALRDFAGQQNVLPRDAAVFLAPSMYFYPPLQPGGDLMHRDMLKAACSRVTAWFFRNDQWSRFSHRVCGVFARSGTIDWSLPMVHPRVFNVSFTQHQMFNSWNSDSAKSQIYKSVEDFQELKVTKPDDLLKQITTGVMNAFDYEKKALDLNICDEK